MSAGSDFHGETGWSVSEKFSQALSDQTTLMKKLTKRCFRIALIPGLILLLLELMPCIGQLIFGS